MATLHTTADKTTVTTKRSANIGRALLVRKVNRFLSMIGKALNTGSLVINK